MEGLNKEQSERAGRGTGGGVGDGVTTNLLQFTDTKEKEERKGREGGVRRRRRGRRRRRRRRATPRQPFYFSVVLQQPLLPWRRKPMIS